MAGGQRALRGFTLLEVMVALAVLAISLAALGRGVSSYLDNASYLQERTLATWVAENRIAELRVLNVWPKPDTTKGSSMLAGREWYWVQEVSALKDLPDNRQVRIQVFAEPDAGASPVATLIALLGRPQR